MINNEYLPLPDSVELAIVKAELQVLGPNSTNKGGLRILCTQWLGEMITPNNEFGAKVIIAQLTEGSQLVQELAGQSLRVMEEHNPKAGAESTAQLREYTNVCELGRITQLVDLSFALSNELRRILEKEDSIE